jgi:hypothetical protein
LRQRWRRHSGSRSRFGPDGLLGKKGTERSDTQRGSKGEKFDSKRLTENLVRLFKNRRAGAEAPTRGPVLRTAEEQERIQERDFDAFRELEVPLLKRQLKEAQRQREEAAVKEEEARKKEEERARKESEKKEAAKKKEEEKAKKKAAKMEEAKKEEEEKARKSAEREAAKQERSQKRNPEWPRRQQRGTQKSRSR